MFMKTLNGLPVYRMTINEDDNTTGVEFISLVDFPAIMVDWVAMSAKRLKLYAADQDKQMVTGPAMIPDMPIYRADKANGEYYVSFDKLEIEKIARKFNREQRTLDVNFQHETDSQVNGSVIVEQWFIQDRNNDKARVLGFDLPEGTWMVSVHFSDKKFWEEEIKTKNVRGFSIEGYLNMQMNKINIQKMEDNTSIKTAAEIKTKDGVVLYTTADAFVEGSDVLVDDGTGKQVPAADGDYVLDNGATITVAGGKITALVDAVEPTTPAAQEAAPEVPVAAEANKFEDEVKALLSTLDERIKALEAANVSLSKENKELSEKFARIPGNSGTVKNDPIVNEPTILTFTEKLAFLKTKQKIK